MTIFLEFGIVLLDLMFIFLGLIFLGLVLRVS